MKTEIIVLTEQQMSAAKEPDWEPLNLSNLLLLVLTLVLRLGAQLVTFFSTEKTQQSAAVINEYCVLSLCILHWLSVPRYPQQPFFTTASFLSWYSNYVLKWSL